MTKKTRKFCLPCRLKVCFQAGMDPQLIRHSAQQKRKILLPKVLWKQPTSLTLLNKDCSILTFDEWTLLTNIINTYDEQNFFLHTKDFFQNQFSLPPKIRSKNAHTLTHIGSLFSTIHKFIERCPLFYSLPSYFRKELIKRNLNTVGGFNGFFMAKEMNIFESEIYSKFIDNIYGHGYSNSLIQASQRLQENGILIKIMSMILIFSSNCTIITIDRKGDIPIILNTKILIDIQNIFVTLLWKYLIYQYGFHQAILRFLSLVKSILDLIQRMDEGLKIQKHWTMVENVIEKTTRALNLEDVRAND